jgi:hypothetical protein
VVSNVAMTLRTGVVAVVFLLVSHSQSGHATPLAAERAADFGFRFQVGDCLTETFDTFTGVFTKDLGGEPARSAPVPLSLPEAQMGTIYQTIEKIRFFDYPSQFVGVSKGLHASEESGPARTYRLEVRNAGVVHAVSWNDASKPTTDEADRLRDLFSMMLGFIHEHPEFKRLPRPVASCE